MKSAVLPTFGGPRQLKLDGFCHMGFITTIDSPLVFHGFSMVFLVVGCWLFHGFCRWFSPRPLQPPKQKQRNAPARWQEQLVKAEPPAAEPAMSIIAPQAPAQVAEAGGWGLIWFTLGSSSPKVAKAPKLSVEEEVCCVARNGWCFHWVILSKSRQY